MDLPVLTNLFNNSQLKQEFAYLQAYFTTLHREQRLTELEALYQQIIRLLEKRMWANRKPQNKDIERLQALYRELEMLMGRLETRSRHHFVVVIQVADRPGQLEQCLQSLTVQLQTFGYGGKQQENYRRVSCIIADDSRDAQNRQYHRQLTRVFSAQGLQCEYLGLEEQAGLLADLPADLREAIAHITGSAGDRVTSQGDACLVRNICYLRLAQLNRQIQPLLCFFMDTDRALPFINYFYHLDHVFSEKNVQVVTGKVVGEPPVSPTVMIGSLLEDIIAFLQRIILLEPDQACVFHAPVEDMGDDPAAYHDMAEIFGIYRDHEKYAYHCDLQGSHTVLDALAAFSEKLDHFFHGVHPTRAIHYQYQDVRASAQPARTLYTGNYVLRPAVLHWFVPFAGMHLPLAGAALGRLLKQALGASFQAVNAPLLHHPNLSEARQSGEDIADEYQRQFFGDLMLLSIEKLLSAGHDPFSGLSHGEIAGEVQAVQHNLLQKYRQQRTRIRQNLKVLRSLLRLGGVSEDDMPEVDDTQLHLIARRFMTFLDKVENNYSESAESVQRLETQAIQGLFCDRIIDAIEALASDRKSWSATINQVSTGQRH